MQNALVLAFGSWIQICWTKNQNRHKFQRVPCMRVYASFCEMYLTVRDGDHKLEFCDKISNKEN